MFAEPYAVTLFFRACWQSIGDAHAGRRLPKLVGGRFSLAKLFLCLNPRS
jgi:hypothetical protein